MALWQWFRSSTAISCEHALYILLNRSHVADFVVFNRGIHTTAQFNSKIFNLKGDGPHNWHSDPLSNFIFDEKMLSFGADNLAVSLDEEGTTYTIRSAVSEDSVVDLTFSRAAPGFVIGKDGTSYFGTDAENPWGSMHHAFWPRCTVQGTIKTKEDTFDLGGRGMFIHAIQGMKPHHAGKSSTGNP